MSKAAGACSAERKRVENLNSKLQTTSFKAARARTHTHTHTLDARTLSPKMLASFFTRPPKHGLLQLNLPIILVIISVSLNVFFLSSWLWSSLSSGHKLISWGSFEREKGALLHQNSQPEAGWSRKACDATEAAALFNCSGNGELYIDTLPSTTGEAASCECYECFTGSQCADMVENCTANVDSGDPMLFAPFWKQNAEQSAVLIPGWYRMGYQLVESGSEQVLPSLEQEIRALHSLVGNAVVDGKYIVLGVGSMLLLNAAVASLSPDNGTASIVSAVPYYGAYQTQTEAFESYHYAWAGDANLYSQHQSAGSGISVEFVTSPNNPDGTTRNAVLNGSNAFTIYDLAYYWPHFTAISTAFDYDVMLFTLSKVTGHAGSRLGWAIVKDYTVYTRLLKRVVLNVIGISHESQLRAAQVLKAVNQAYCGQLRHKEKPLLSFPPAYYASNGLSFHYAYATLRYRWKKLSETLAASQRLALQQLEPGYCNFFKEVTGPSPAYAWVHCKQDNDEDCKALLSQAGITSRAGSVFGSSDRYTRLSLLKRDSVFENLVGHLSRFVSKEDIQESLDPKSNL